MILLLLMIHSTVSFPFTAIFLVLTFLKAAFFFFFFNKCLLDDHKLLSFIFWDTQIDSPPTKNDVHDKVNV